MASYGNKRREPLRPARSASELARRNVELIAEMQRAASERRTLGERVADSFAAAVGSWSFILLQTVLLALWVALNVVAWSAHWDPYPFILLNLVLSFQAAYAAPIIMMSQNREARLAERRNHLDLQLNLLAEQEATETLRLLRRLCEKCGIPLEDDQALRALEEATRPEHLLREIERRIEHNGQEAKKPSDRKGP